jgi:hypothetical protein
VATIEQAGHLKRNGAQLSAKGPAENFTERVDPLYNTLHPARASSAYVTFEPCARSNWHTHIRSDKR